MLLNKKLKYLCGQQCDFVSSHHLVDLLLFKGPLLSKVRLFHPLKLFTNIVQFYQTIPIAIEFASSKTTVWMGYLLVFSPCLLKKDRAEGMGLFWSKGITQCLRSWDLSGSALADSIPDKVWESYFMSGQILSPHEGYSVSHDDETVTLIKMIHLYISE